jgi:hypothetical protein
MNKPAAIELDLYAGCVLADPAPLADLLSAFESSPRFVPTYWGADERVRLDYSREAIHQHASSHTATGGVHLARDRSVKYDGYFGLRRNAFLSFEFDKAVPSSRSGELLELADRIAAAIRPRFGVFHVFKPTPVPWRNERERLLRWMNFAAQPIPVRFRPNGPLGLGMRPLLKWPNWIGVGSGSI